MRNRAIFCALAGLIVLMNACGEKLPSMEELQKPDSPDSPEAPVVQKVDIELLSPEEEDSFDLGAIDGVEFEWKPIEGVTDYKVRFSLRKSMSNAKEMDVSGTPVFVDASAIDACLEELGVQTGQPAVLYWSVTAVQEGVESDAEVRTIIIKRGKQKTDTDAERIADPLVVKVAIVIEDPVVNEQGQRMHEVCGWNDPKVQYKEFKRDLEASSHGVVKYEIVDIVQSEKMYSYHRNDVNPDEKEFVTIDTLLNYYFPNGLVDNIFSYDYVGMMNDHGYGEMVDAGELDEIWVYIHPAGGMYESRLIGKGAFWCNSPGLGPSEGAPCEELCCVMCCNYERTTDLALHAYAHRVESIMCRVYGAWNYDFRFTVNTLSNWEKFSAHNREYEKYKAEHAHIGMCHWPPNSEADYDYGNTRFVYSYADTWYDYPDIKEDNARRINCKEWTHPGGDQWGYMMWYFDHIPHFKGLCPRDAHLNNWWHYIVHYNAAVKYEKELKNAQKDE